ncbi:MAG: hypothetical protein DRQ51_02935 [Gammaproteobacteria bacterium]|nr:MAG: hypothetical protein DRQ51_02935 [Gammaproteobacteria bacterium]
MLSEYSSIQSGDEICKFFGFPKELKGYEVKVLVKPISSKPKQKKTFKDLEKTAKKLRTNLPENYNFNRKEIYEHLYHFTK